ncbi:hypothetical protein [Intestinibacter bartlettii]|uniref:Uncharacterized protein n=1 Tax=Intestinibacter bartlettii TaxID=261299 RepID=A0ABS8CZ38_9FIRM|nr:hypothetical protein [Intestinibacter bartlettii]MCB5398367.1 hypothetical protein [Intestinibacter bartlettii]MCB5404314.1 hypothetical protein [Intestinibacter bartlettii]MCB5446721.1 hypothetical protein [Intestinibacter bartlettii]MCB5749449.1 hypothetical protein [Intestinibacter bartlettii]
MSKKFSKSRVIIFSIILLILIGFAFIQNKNLITDQTVNNPLFLQYKGDIYIDKKDKSLNLPFVFIDSTNSKLFNDLSDKIKSNNQYTSNDFLLFKDKTNNIEIYLKEADKGSNYKNTCLYSILLEIKFLDKGNSYTINSLNLLDKTYSIGDIYIERVANGDELELYYNIGFTESMDKYYVQLINESGNIIDSLKLKNADYIDKVYYFINGKRVKEVKNLKPKDKLKILILFKDDLKKYNMFYFSPKIEYKTKYGNKSDVIPFATYGEVKQDEILDIYKKLENNQ